MFEEAQLYSPVTKGEDGSVEVHLGDNHPGFKDLAYRARRNEIAALAMAWQRGEPIPHIDYLDVETDIWVQVCRQLADKHAQHAHPEYLAAKERLGLPTDHIPQLDDVTALLHPLTGFRYVAAPGLVELREFYGSLADREFHSTQYTRHPSEPFYTPEPDIIHEVIGHGNQLASPRFAALTHAAGEATRRAERDETVQFIADIFWFTMEFGVMWDGTGDARDLKAYGAGILSSFGEMDEYAHMEIRPLDLAQMGTLNYDITSYQPVLFAAESLDQLEDVVGSFFAECDDETPARITKGMASV
ncbi:phenylalanine 4-monooxygenase [Xylanimonas sp. McL0601]|uniref:phenylalanine 4-monooxygenase n=1 Tax=Xylanimonas sp. McL0601 TaxID=3414739 RepID=UPI003CF78FFF